MRSTEGEIKKRTICQQFDGFFERCRLATFQFGKSLFGFRGVCDGVHDQSELSQLFMSPRFVKGGLALMFHDCHVLIGYKDKSKNM